ncbi:hypothetical protein ACVNPX_09525 [Staphylococcus aureus]
MPVQSLIDDDYLKARSTLIDSNKANIDIEHVLCLIALVIQMLKKIIPKQLIFV